MRRNSLTELLPTMDHFYRLWFTPQYPTYGHYLRDFVTLRSHSNWGQVLRKTYGFYLKMAAFSVRLALLGVTVCGHYRAFFQYDLLATLFDRNRVYNPEIYIFILMLLLFIVILHFQIHFSVDFRLWKIVYELSEQNYQNFVHSIPAFSKIHRLDRVYSMPIRSLWTGYDGQKRIKFAKKIPGFVAISSRVLSQMVLVYRLLNLLYFSVILLYGK